MEASTWVGGFWFVLLQSVGIIGSLLFAGYEARRNEKALKFASLIFIKEHHQELWKPAYDHPELFRVLDAHADLKRKPLSNEEILFVKSLFFHLDTVHRAKKAGLFTDIEGLPIDVGEFIHLPIPKAVWERIKRFQNADFVTFVEASQNAKLS